MKIALAADHRGYDVMLHLRSFLHQEGCEVRAWEQSGREVSDYPDVAYPVAMAVQAGAADRGILVCGSGIGMCIAANKVAGIRAALVHDEIGAEVSRRHNDANVLCLPADMLGLRIIDRIVIKWLRADFEGGRHARRIRKIAAIESGADPATIDARPERV